SGGGRIVVEREALEDLELRVQLGASGNTAIAKGGFSMLEEGSRTYAACPAIAGNDRAALQLLGPAPSGFLREPSRRLAYEQVLGARTEELQRVKDKIVLVGLMKPDVDVHPVAKGFGVTDRYGIELIADQVDAIQRGEVIRPLGGYAQLLLMLLLALG